MFAQENSTKYCIRTLQKSTVIVVQDKDKEHYLFEDYGKIAEKTKLEGKGQFVYLFQGQEYDWSLNLLFFPSRIYSPREKRFLQVDPKSQYYSPYAFVGGDPINLIDYDGKEGKPLILNGEYKDAPFFQSETEVLSDAYHYSIKDFVENKIPKLGDWDGNVYVNTHMRTGTEYSIMVDAIERKSVGASMGVGAASSSVDKPLLRYTSDKHFGDRLYQFSVDQNVPVRNVLLGGCQGEVAASGVRQGFDLQAQRGGDFKGSEVNFFGTRKGWDVAGLKQEGAGQKYISLGWSRHHAEFSGKVYQRAVTHNGISKTEYVIFPQKGIKEFLQVNPDENTVSDILNRGHLSDLSGQFITQFHSVY